MRYQVLIAGTAGQRVTTLSAAANLFSSELIHRIGTDDNTSLSATFVCQVGARDRTVSSR